MKKRKREKVIPAFCISLVFHILVISGLLISIEPNLPKDTTIKIMDYLLRFL